MNKNGKDNTNNNNNNFELTHLLNRRRVIMDTKKTDIELPNTTYKLVNLYREFHEFSRKQIKEYEITFNTYDTSGNGLLELNELKYIMEKLGAPQTHLDLKKHVAEVAKDNGNKISFPQFLMIYRNVKACELLDTEAEMNDVVETPLPPEIDVDEVGVSGAKTFFETKIKQQYNNKNHRNQELEDHNRRYKNEEQDKRFTKNNEKFL